MCAQFTPTPESYAITVEPLERRQARRAQSQKTASENSGWFSSIFSSKSARPALGNARVPYATGTVFNRQYRITEEWTQRLCFQYRTAVDLARSEAKGSDDWDAKVLIRVYIKQSQFKKEARMLLQLGGDYISQVRAVLPAHPSEPRPASSLLVLEPAVFTANHFWDAHRGEPDMLSELVRPMMINILEALCACRQADIVHNNVRSFNIFFCPSADGDAVVDNIRGRWKLSRFDMATRSGETIRPKQLEYAASESAKAQLNGLPLRSYSAMDMFEWGRTLQFFLYAYQLPIYSVAFFNGIVSLGNGGRMRRLKYLAEEKHVMYDVEHVPSREWREVLRLVVQREPASRATAQHVLKYLRQAGSISESDKTTPKDSESDAHAMSFVTEEHSVEDKSFFNPKDLKPNQLILGQYELLSPAGSSASMNVGLVWRVLDSDAGVEVVLKFHRGLDGFLRETDSLRALKHPNIVELLDAFEQDDDAEFYPYALSVIEAGIYSLREYARYQLPLRLTKLKMILEDIANGLKACHDQGIVHADCKLSNVMMFRVHGSAHDQVERWKLIDFDASCMEGDPVTKSTMEYLAPELASAVIGNYTLPAKPSLDLFALGRMLQWLCIVRTQALSDDETEIFWPGHDSQASVDDKQRWLASSDEISVAEEQVPHGPTRNLIRQLLVKDPASRLTLSKLMTGSFMAMNIDTQVLVAQSRA